MGTFYRSRLLREERNMKRNFEYWEHAYFEGWLGKLLVSAFLGLCFGLLICCAESYCGASDAELLVIIAILFYAFIGTAPKEFLR